MVAVSAETKKNLIKEFGITVPIEVIENSIDTKVLSTSPVQKADLRRKLGYSKQDFIVVSNGQIQPRKKFDEFVKVARQLPQFKFIWVGGFMLKGALKGLLDDQAELSEAIKNLPSNMIVTGVIPLEKARDYLRIGDVYFHPAIQETFGIAIIEGAAAGLPVLLRDIPDYDQTFGANAIRVKSSEFVKTLQKLHDDQKFRQKYIAESARLAARYDNSVAADKLVKLYRSLLK
jgi:1,2-diacylglycerol-3-alpha-glucose alpha-1,2-galactosyltransferase